MFTVYVLRSQSSGRLYTGQTDDLTRRFEEHQQGMARYTGARGPWEIVHTEDYPTRAEAMAREKYLKSGQGRSWFKEVLER